MDFRRMVPAVLLPFLLAFSGGDSVLFKNSSTDFFLSRCEPLPDPPPGGFLRWSNPATWGQRPIPGVGGAAWGNATIPCGAAVLLDVPLLRLHTLEIQGFLRVEDPVQAVTYSVQASFVIVEGQLSIGSPTQHFRSHITFTLLPNPNRRLPFIATFNPPGPAPVGHKAFAVVGGRLELHGMPGGSDTPSWVRLAATAYAASGSLLLGSDVNGLWPVGARAVVASTDFYPEHAEVATISSVSSNADGTSSIQLSRRLKYSHYGEAVADGFGGRVEERAEVALLSRNIVIEGQQEQAPWELEGGHLVVFRTQAPQHIEGVELVGMGQQGVLGRYPLHFHVCGDTAGLSSLRKNAIHHSLQRCVVVHATHNLTVEGNVAYDTRGHCFITEEGGEQGNSFVGNLGMLTRPVERLIPLSPSSTASEETDDRPATFWLSSMANNYVGNVAAGSFDSGFWTELRAGVRGMSALIPSLARIVPIRGRAGVFQGNVAHSNRVAGVRFYPHGYFPSTTTSFSGFRIYKHALDGMAIHHVQNVEISKSVFADNQYGVHVFETSRVSVHHSRFVGLSPNTGTRPSFAECADRRSGPRVCAPIYNCQFPPNNPSNRRGLGNSTDWRTPLLGVAFGASNSQGRGIPVNIVHSSQFAFYSALCRPAAALGMGITPSFEDFWSAGTQVYALRRAPGTPAIWAAPPEYRVGAQTYAVGPVAAQFALWDRDGSVGARRGFAVSPTPALLPPAASRRRCRASPGGGGALACPGTCYRTVAVHYLEHGFTPLLQGQQDRRFHGLYSWVKIRRISDNAELASDGNLHHLYRASSVGGRYGLDPALRSFYFNLYAPAAYVVVVVPPFSRPNFTPASVNFSYVDGSGCGQQLHFKLYPKRPTAWTRTRPLG